MWVYVNMQTTDLASKNDAINGATIFSYGVGKPKLTYINNSKVNSNNIRDSKNRDMYNFYFTDSQTTPYKTSMPSQKWNNVVFNYIGNHVDLFINGELVTTFEFDNVNMMPAYSSDDIIYTGQDINGLYGAICNIVHTKTSLAHTQIINNYNFLMLKNPPVLQI
jgi:hypothetical protein